MRMLAVPASVLRLDELFGGLISELKRRKIFDDTVVVLVSDHGENLGEHGLLGHRHSFYAALTDVPLIIRYPPRFPPGRVARPVVTIDLFRTILDLVELPAPEIVGLKGYSLCDSEKSLPHHVPLVSAWTPHYAGMRSQLRHPGFDAETSERMRALGYGAQP